jgi:mercuric reductase
MSDSIQAAVERLARQLPLQERQAALPPAYLEVHRAMLRTLATKGRPLSRSEIATMLPDGDVGAVLARLGDDDLVVLNSERQEAVGAYPMTTEATPHHLSVDGLAINAMCALDALAVGPMYGARVEVNSRCQVTGDPVRLRLDGDRLTAAEPSSGVKVGIAWQKPCGHAAHSMCREMVFLRDEATAREWQAGDAEGRSVFSLAEGIDFAGRFFRPLVS